MASISVIIPTYNGAAYLPAALDSVFTQSRRPDEVIIVDDFSTDGTAELADLIARSAPVPLRVVRQPRNSGGPAEPLTIGFRMAAGEYIAALDQDDMFLPQKLERQAALLDGNCNVGFVFGGFATTTTPHALNRQTVFDKLGGRGQSGVMAGVTVLRLLLRHGNFIGGFPGFTFRRAIWDRIGRLDRQLRIAADYDFMCAMAQAGLVGFVNEVHYLRRWHADNLSRRLVDLELDTALVLTSYLPTLDRAAVAADEPAIRKQCYDAVFAARDAGRYRDALDCLWRIARVWGWGRREWVCGGKLLAHRMLTGLQAGSRLRKATHYPAREKDGL